MKTAMLVLLAATAVAGCDRARQEAVPGEPPLSERTRASGGVPSATQRATRFDAADLAIEVFPATRRIEGVATLRLTPRQPLDRIELDLDSNLPVTEIAIDGMALSTVHWSHDDGRVTIRLPGPAVPGQPIALRIGYGGTPHVAVRAPWDGGFVWAQTPTGAPFVATAVQLQGCDLFWPCFDHPQAEPATVDLHITVPEGLSAPANGVPLGVRTHADGRRTFDWRTKRPNTYGIALNVGPYRLLRATYRSRFGNRIPLYFWHLPGKPAEARRLFAEFAPTLDFFETMIGPYPFGDEKVGVVETPHKGMEHQTINAYGNHYARTAFGFDDLFQHEFAHEWFANQLTNVDADDFWLQEGFGSYMQPLYAEWRGGQMAYLASMHDLRSGIRNCAPIVSGRSRTVEQVYLPEHGPAGDIYAKGAWVLHTLRGLIGDDAFFTATRRLVYGRPDPRPGNFAPRYASTAEFQRIASEEAGRDLGWFFDVYLREAKLPHLVTRRVGDRLMLRWRTPDGRPFPMPVEVQLGRERLRVTMAYGRGALAVPAGAHVVIDPEGKILKRSDDIDALQRWQYGEARRKFTESEANDDPPRAPCIAV